MRVLIFGDSITQGFWDIEGGWAARLRKGYDQVTIDNDDFDQPTIFNLGISGNTSSNLLMRFENEVKARATEEVAIVIAIGVNDAMIMNGENYSDVNRYRKNLAELLALSKRYSEKILFVGLTPCIDQKTNPVIWDDSVSYLNNRIREFDDALKQFCIESQTPFVEVFDQFAEALDKSELLPDGLHPNDKGHQLITELVLPKLKEILA